MMHHSTAVGHEPVVGHIVQGQDCVWQVKALAQVAPAPTTLIHTSSQSACIHWVSFQGLGRLGLGTGWD